MPYLFSKTKKATFLNSTAFQIAALTQVSYSNTARCECHTKIFDFESKIFISKTLEKNFSFTEIFFKRKMTTMYDVDAQELIEKAAEELKKIPELKPPVWAAFVKTGMHKERPPFRNDWWYFRAASVLRAVYRLQPIGVSKLRSKYGGKKNRGVKTEHRYKGSGSVLRKALQQLEKAGFVKFAEKSVHKGRVITPKGKSFLDKIATQINSLKPAAKSDIKAPTPK